jgi:hypothetical protein
MYNSSVSSVFWIEGATLTVDNIFPYRIFGAGIIVLYPGIFGRMQTFLHQLCPGNGKILRILPGNLTYFRLKQSAVNMAHVPIQNFPGDRSFPRLSSRTRKRLHWNLSRCHVFSLLWLNFFSELNFSVAPPNEY